MVERRTRGRASTIQTLPDDIKSRLDDMLRDSGTTQQDIVDEVNAMLDEAGVEKQVSKSALNRYSTRMETMGAKIRESREVAEMWVAKLGSKPTGEVGQVLIEMLRSMAFDATLHAGQDEDPVSPQFIKELALGIMRLEKAAETSSKRESEIRKAFAKEAADKTAETLASSGMSANTIIEIKRQILGVA